MSTIYQIIGGGQRVRQNVDLGLKTNYKVVEISDFVEKAKCHGQDSFTNMMWSTSFSNIQKWANDWAGETVTLVQEENN
jgi:hypothetical protein